MISIDTYKSAVAKAALDQGADIINDISSFRLDPKMPEVAAAAGAGLVLMNMRGTPESMQQIPPSNNILKEVCSQLEKAVLTAYSHQIERDRIVLDPGIGFGKTVDDNLQILNRLSFLEELGLPVLVGPSRKSFLGEVLQLPEEDRLWGTAASLAVSILKGAHILRVHDVTEARMVADVTDAILAESPVQ